MLVQSVTVGLPVTDLERSVEWYRRAFQLDDPDLEPAEGIVEFRVGGIWLQLGQAASGPAGTAAIVRFGVQDIAVERVRLASLGVAVGGLDRVDGILEYFDFSDPDGNRLSLYEELEP
nr:VOC family protein [Propionicimonas sp.]